jgi:hypothetical protein
MVNLGSLRQVIKDSIKANQEFVEFFAEEPIWLSILVVLLLPIWPIVGTVIVAKLLRKYRYVCRFGFTNDGITKGSVYYNDDGLLLMNDEGYEIASIIYFDPYKEGEVYISNSHFIHRYNWVETYIVGEKTAMIYRENAPTYFIPLMPVKLNLIRQIYEKRRLDKH